MAIIGYEWLIIIPAIACALWVNIDAGRREAKNAALWTVVAFLFPILGLLLYLLVGRKTSQETRVCPKCGLVMPASHNFCPSCGKQFPLAQEQRSRNCVYCGRKVAQDAKFCDACGKTQPTAGQSISQTETTAAGKPHRMRIPYFIGYFAMCFLVMALVTVFLPSGLVAPHWYEILVLEILLAVAVAAVATLRRKP